MKLHVDFHIHTVLSPCGEDGMTPNNIVNMALLNELDAIAITDHNSAENVKAVMEVAKSTDLIVIPGIEIETREEIHVLGLFLSLEDVYNVQKKIYASLPTLHNRVSIFGSQKIMNKDDDVVKELEQFLSTAVHLSLNEVIGLIHTHGGIAIPAHIDRPSYSILSNLGMIPEDLQTSVLEVSRFADLATYKKKYKDYTIIQSSDAHELGYIGIARHAIDVEDKSIQSVFKALHTLS
ncbi:PHP domain-containing protein [Vallitalea pronyensis]|uniref:PHP domain-containing protein n=1 Tax=Vallitalea pronyensis TaxID=1348613 RepID=A0A8J8SIZ6_9FIRM|nr:PHP domain-containing protein [Vallitalea pronyensis]QUI24959.1 PHP domain-containing protein [Vallitalea pronyensis]